ncbi:hypothetical protein RCL1_003179 [Eukaryota sp. TZLM3-RCL]
MLLDYEEEKLEKLYENREDFETTQNPEHVSLSDAISASITRSTLPLFNHLLSRQQYQNFTTSNYSRFFHVVHEVNNDEDDLEQSTDEFKERLTALLTLSLTFTHSFFNNDDEQYFDSIILRIRAGDQWLKEEPNMSSYRIWSVTDTPLF